MSTPNEGPERGGLTPWTPGDVTGAARALSELNPREQQALGRVIRAAAAVGPIINGVARGIRVIRNTLSRLSQRAVEMFSASRTKGQAAVGSVRDTASNVREGAANRAGELSQQAGEAVGRARDTAVNARDWTVDQSVGMTQRAAEGLSAAGRAAANAGRNVTNRAAEFGRSAMATGQDVAGRAAGVGRSAVAAGQDLAGRAVATGQAAGQQAGRWFNQQVSRGAAKASAALAGLAARRSDPTLTAPDQKLEKRDVLLAQKAADLFTAPDNQRAAKAAELAAFVQTEYGGQQATGPEQSAGPQQAVEGDRNVAASQEMAWILQANPPASEIHSNPDAGKESESTSEQPGTGRHRGQPGQTQNGLSK